MTAVPPPVPPEIVRRVFWAIADHCAHPSDTTPLRGDDCEACAQQADDVLAVYGDIVEAARRDALMAAVALAAGWPRDATSFAYNEAVADIRDALAALRDGEPCDHPSSTGDEGPGIRHVVRWRCDACDGIHYSDEALASLRAERDAALALHRDAMATMAAEVERLRGERDEARGKLASLREHTLDSNPALRPLHDQAVLYRNAVQAYGDVHGPLSTTLEWVIRHGSLSPKEPTEADRDRAVRDARRDALDQAVEAIRAMDHMHPQGPQCRGHEIKDRAASIVAGLRDENAPRDGLRASVGVRQGESGSTPTRDGDGPQVAAEGFRA